MKGYAVSDKKSKNFSAVLGMEKIPDVVSADFRRGSWRL